MNYKERPTLSDCQELEGTDMLLRAMGCVWCDGNVLKMMLTQLVNFIKIILFILNG